MTKKPQPTKPRTRYGDRNRLQDYRTVFNSEEGRRVLYDLCARHWVFGGTLHESAQVMAHREGERNAVLEILRYLEMRPQDVGTIRQSMVEQFGLADVGDEDDGFTQNY